MECYFQTTTDGKLTGSLTPSTALQTLISAIGAIAGGDFDAQEILNDISEGVTGDFTYTYDGAKGVITIASDEEDEEDTSYNFTCDGNKLVIYLGEDGAALGLTPIELTKK